MRWRWLWLEAPRSSLCHTAIKMHSCFNKAIRAHHRFQLIQSFPLRMKLPQNCWDYFSSSAALHWRWCKFIWFLIYTCTCSRVQHTHTPTHTHFIRLTPLIFCLLFFLFLFSLLTSYFLVPSPGAVYLEGGLKEARQLFGRLLFNAEVKSASLGAPAPKTRRFLKTLPMFLCGWSVGRSRKRKIQ